MSDHKLIILDQKLKYQIKDLFEAGTSESSKRALRGDLNYFTGWLQVRYQVDISFPIYSDYLIAFIVEHIEGLPEFVEKQLIELGYKAKSGTHAISTIERRLASLATAHKLQGLESPITPAIRELIKKAKQAKRYRPNKKYPLTKDEIEQIIASSDSQEVETPTMVRDLALVLFAFSSGGRRRSEVAEARLENLRANTKGFIYHLTHSKTDQLGQGLELPVMGKAARYMNKWLNIRGKSEGFLFNPIYKNGRIDIEKGLTGKSVANIIKKLAFSIDLSPSVIGGHSIRRGFVTEAGRQNIPIPEAMALTGHKNIDIFMGYYQAGKAERNPAGRLLDDEE